MMKHDRETYGEWRLRVQNEQNDFTRAEHREVLEYEAWSREHPLEVLVLDRYVGRLVALRKAHHTFAGDVLDRHEVRGLPVHYARGTLCRVRARLRDRLLAREERDGTLLLLAREWVTLHVTDVRVVRAPRRLVL
jgi:hypothetical protein